MNKEQLNKGIALQKDIEDFEIKIKAAKNWLAYPEHTSVKLHFDGYSPCDIDIVIKADVIRMFKDHYEKLLEKAKEEFENL